MNALEAASLVMIPSGYENGTLGSLKPTDGTGDFTFSRGSDISATRVNEDGYIEKGYENLLLQSNQFDTTWTNYLIDTPTSGQAGYDGTSNAWLIECVSTSNFNGTRQVISTTGVNTLSVYAKAGTTNFLGFFSSAGFGAFELTGAGATGQLYGSAIDSKIELISNGWYRCSIVLNGNASAVIIGARKSINSFNADIGDNIYIQDAMLNQGMVSYPYVETTTAPVAGGILEDMPRLDYSNGSCPSLLLEPERTNLVTYSEYFNSFTLVGSASITPNTSVSPEGYYNAYTLSVPSSGYIIYQKGLYSAVTGESITISIFVKNQINNFLSFGGGTPSGTDVYSIEDYGNGWYRHINTRTFTTTTTGTIQYLIFNQIGTHIIYGAQMEAGSYPTSYIPTYGVSQTRLRAIDAAVIDTPIVFNADDDFTFFIDLFAFRIINLYGGVMAYGGRPASQSYFYISFGRTIIRGDVGDMFRSNSPLLNANEQSKLIFNRSSGVMKMFYNGQEITDTTTINANQSFTFNSLGNAFSPSLFYSYEGTINQFLVFPTALSDDECIELTTI